MNDIVRTMTKLVISLLLTAILAAGVSVLVMNQQFEINDLKNQNIETLKLLKEFQTKQLNFDKSVTAKLTKHSSPYPRLLSKVNS